MKTYGHGSHRVDAVVSNKEPNAKLLFTNGPNISAVFF